MFLISGLININGNDKLPVFKKFIHKKLEFLHSTIKYKYNKHNNT
jgi:glutathione peroxidase-family protein